MTDGRGSDTIAIMPTALDHPSTHTPQANPTIVSSEEFTPAMKNLPIDNTQLGPRINHQSKDIDHIANKLVDLIRSALMESE